MQQSNIFDKQPSASSWNPSAEKRTKQAKHTAKNGKNTDSLFAGHPLISKGMSPKTGAGTVDYAVGDRVSHIRFGKGEVLEMKDTGGDYQVLVAFENGVNRKMMASFAKLEKIQG